MGKALGVYHVLEGLGIPYTVAEHPPALTTEEADGYIEGMEGIRTKTLFLCNRKKTAYYLVIMEGSKRLDMKKLAGLLGEKGVQFASEEALMARLSLAPGSVSVFGLLNDGSRKIRVCVDKEIPPASTVTFHPNDNTKTIFLSAEGMYCFLAHLGYECAVLEL